MMRSEGGGWETKTAREDYKAALEFYILANFKNTILSLSRKTKWHDENK
jgi:hypothetical protein